MIPAAPISCSDRQEIDERSSPSPAGPCLPFVKARQEIWVASNDYCRPKVSGSRPWPLPSIPNLGSSDLRKVSENDRSIQQSQTRQQRGFPSTRERGHLYAYNLDSKEPVLAKKRENFLRQRADLELVSPMAPPQSPWTVVNRDSPPGKGVINWVLVDT